MLHFVAGGDSMNEIAQLLNDGEYSKVYEKLLCMKEAFVQDTYSLEFFCGQHLNSVNVEKKFAYFNYALARKESVEIHLFIGLYLLYGDYLFDDIHTVINWHFRRAIEIFNNNPKVLREILTHYKDHPDSPFSKEEIKNYEILLKMDFEK